MPFYPQILPLQSVQQINDIVSLAHRQPLMQDQLQLLQEKTIAGPSATAFTCYRYRLFPGMHLEDVGVLSYQYHPKNKGERKIELRFCVSGNSYCEAPACNSGNCKNSTNCHQIPTFDILIFSYPAAYLQSFIGDKKDLTKTDELLAFKRTSSFTFAVTLCNRTRTTIDQLFSHQYAGAMEHIFVGSQLQSLLLYGLDCLVEEKVEESFTCKFLTNETDREKILLAKEILLQRIGDPITIKELSRKVGTNECYLKKGFKELFGSTIFDFYQNQRMDHARYLLYEKGLSVTEVSALLGYSSISHFSTAFKRHTGLKPCELLLR